MTEPLSTTQKEYLRSQLHYDHREGLPPPNTLAVHQIQHGLIRNAVERYARNHEIHMLDVGCCWGDFSEKLDPFLKSYVGVEPSPTELRRFKKLPNRFLVRGVGEHLGYLKDHSRNFILLNSVLDHCYDWKQTFAHCLRILAPGGLLVISMENAQKLTVRLRQALGREHIHEGHLEFFGLDDTRELLRPDFQILEARTIGFLFGMHAVTKRVPLPVAPLRLLNRAVNGFFRLAAPNGGHIFFIAAIRNGAPLPASHFAQPFRCHQCQTGLDFGTTLCPQCGASLPYAPEGYFDAVEINPSLKAELDLK